MHAGGDDRSPLAGLSGWPMSTAPLPPNFWPMFIVAKRLDG